MAGTIAINGRRCLAGLLAIGALVGSPARADAQLVSTQFANLLAAAPATVTSRPFFTSSKSAAILGGMSQLELIAAQQRGVITASEAAGLQSAMMIPASRPSLMPSLPETSFTAPVLPVSADRPDIFGSIALSVSRTPLDRQWRRASLSHFNRKGAWTPLIDSSRSLSRSEQLQAVNKWVNARIRFVEDRDQYGRVDYWAGGADSIRRGRGDCEDYALAKRELLQSLGFAADDIYLAVVKDLVRRADHAVLIVRSEGRFLVLDNNTDRLVDARANQDYRPVFTYGATQSWTHGYAVQRYTGPVGSGPVRIAAR